MSVTWGGSYRHPSLIDRLAVAIGRGLRTPQVAAHQPRIRPRGDFWSPLRPGLRALARVTARPAAPFHDGPPRPSDEPPHVDNPGFELGAAQQP